MFKIRRAYEVLFLGLFLFFLVITDLRYLKGWPVSLFLEATPLVAVATALTTHTLYRNLVWGLVVIALTMMLGWVVGLIFVGLLVANWYIPRFFCRALCPLGALLGIFSRFALWRIDRDPVLCTDCDLCLKNCEGASDPHTDLRKSECFVCLNCIED